MGIEKLVGAILGAGLLAACASFPRYAAPNQQCSSAAYAFQSNPYHARHPCWYGFEQQKHQLWRWQEQFSKPSR